ncbi:hypothetical protein WJX81_001522 [Elliptochloris bilobata]|uniref:Thioredoxin domain-containing protein n=1 Tax=Elliptochloris bilobata TaxID=381761 RepID=A0AAW1RNH4_9CHLO
MKSLAQWREVLESAPAHTLLVVDFYKTSCGACRYIQAGFVKLCRASTEDPTVAFFKHNVMDEFEEKSEIADELRIRAVPMFCFFRGGKLVDQFATRERKRVAAAINHHAGHEVLQAS